MSYQNFADYVASFGEYAPRLAMTIRRGLRIERISYGQLQELIYRSANFLLTKDIGPGDRVMIIADNSPEWVEVLLATQLIGAILVPIDATSTLDAALNFVAETKPKFTFRSRYLLPELESHITTLVIEDLGLAIANYAAILPELVPLGELDAVVVFTSGTTAAPKGVILTQSNLLANVMGMQSALEISPDWRLLSVLPLSHTYELTGGCLAPLSRGSALFYLEHVTPRTIAKAMVDYHITTLIAIPELLVIMLDTITRNAEQEGKARTLRQAIRIAALLPFSMRRMLFHSVHSRLGHKLDLVVTGGAPIPIEVATAWEMMGVRVIQGYGLTETSPILTVNRLDARRLDTPGRPLDNVELRIGVDEEIQARGPSIFKGYWYKPEATQAAFTDDDWFKTGDVGSIDDGWLKIQGGLKFAIVLASGLKVFPEDIELVASRNPIFKEICAVGVKSDAGEEVQVVVVSSANDRKVDKAVGALNVQLASFQHIAAWRRWPDASFPRTRLMKIDRKVVWEWANSADDAWAKPGNVTPDAKDPIAEILRLVVGDADLEISDSQTLADLGLDSLRRMTAVALIRDRLRAAIGEEDVNQFTTFAQLRTLAAQAGATEHIETIPTWQFHPWIRRLGYFLRETVIAPLVEIWVHLKIEGQDRLDGLNSPAIFIFNHTDDFDGPVIYQALPPEIRRRLAVAVADDVLHDHKVLSFVARLCYAGFNMRRKEPFIPSLEYIGELVDKGWNIVLAPEGRISKTGKIQPFKDGVGLLAVSLAIPVVPIKTVGLTGTVPLHAKWPRRHSQVTVRIGEPIVFAREISPEEATTRLHDIVEKL